MMRWLGLLLILSAAAGAVLAALMAEDPGYVLIHIGGYTLESTVAALVALLLLVLAGGALLWRLLRGGLSLPARVSRYLHQRRTHRAQLQFQSGLLRFASGQWQKAEVELLRRAADQDDPVVNYLFAAQAAQRLGAVERRDRYLELASHSGPEAEAAVLMQRARLLAEESRNAEALVALDELGKLLPRHLPALELRLQLLERMRNWTALGGALNEARGQIDEARLQQLSEQVWCHALRDAAHKGQLAALRACWKEVPKALRRKAPVLTCYCALLHELNADAEGLRLLAGALKAGYEPELVRAYGRLDGDEGVAQLASVEQWIKQYGEQPELLLVAGRLCLRSRLWGRARSYFEAGLNLAPNPEFQLELGRLARQQGENEGVALEHFQRGLEMATESAAAQAALPAPESG